MDFEPVVKDLVSQVNLEIKFLKKQQPKKFSFAISLDRLNSIPFEYRSPVFKCMNQLNFWSVRLGYKLKRGFIAKISYNSDEEFYILEGVK